MIQREIVKGGAVTTVEFGLLGSIEARVDGRLVKLGHARQRLLLAALLLDLGHEVPIGELADRIWGEDHAQRGTLYGYLSRLRKALAGVEGVEIARRTAGYLLTADPATVDLYRFRDLVGRARTAEDDQQAAELFGQALDLWRGEALAGVDTEWACAVRENLHQEQLAVELDRAEVRLRLGQHAELVTGLHDLAARYPLDERLAGQLMLALYRSGRTAGALGHYQATHRTLARELGLDPGPELRELHQQILSGDPVLDTGTAEADGSAGRSAVRTPVPRHLPAPPALFTGRTRELDRLTTVLDEQGGPGSTMVISAIGGVGGVGKTYLALHWAHHHVEHFPDGQLFVNLRGFDPTAEPMAPSTAVCGFLETLGVAPSAIPDGLDAQSALFRSLVAGKCMLVVLDNAHDSDQVVPLLPGSPTCTVLVTSRRRLAGLVTTQGATPLPLDALPEAEARALLVRHLGEDRLAAEPDAVATLLKHCAGLPLALSITAARAATQPDLPLAHLAEELTETETRLDALDTGELTSSLRAVFDTSRRTLPPEAARVFALLGLAPGPDIGLPAVASLLGTTVCRAQTLLRILEDAHLVRQHTPGRYRMHDLVHLYAAEHGRALDKQERDTALRRLIDFYLHTAYHVSTLIDPQPTMPLELAPPAPGCTPHRPTGHKAAMAWYDAERACLPAVQQLAADLGWHTLAWQLPHALAIFYWYRFPLRDALDMLQVGLEAAERSDDPRPAATTHTILGYTYTQAHQLPEALHHLDQALAVFEQTGDLLGLAFTHWAHATAVLAGQAPQRGAHHAEHAARLYRTLGHTTGECYSLNAACWSHALFGDHQQANACGKRAVALGRTLSSPGPAAYALTLLSSALSKNGRYTEALDHHHQAIVLHRQYGNLFWEAVTLAYLGRTYQALGQTAEARHALQHARDIFRTQHRTAEAERVQRRLDSLDNARTAG